MKNYSFKVSLNIVSFITEIIILYNASNIKNTDTLYKFVIKIRSMISVQLQSMMIITMSFKMNQTDIAA